MLFNFFIKPDYHSLERILSNESFGQNIFPSASLTKEILVNVLTHIGICSQTLTQRICTVYVQLHNAHTFPLILAALLRILYTAVNCPFRLPNLLPWQIWKCPRNLILWYHCPSFFLIFQWYILLIWIAPAALGPLWCWNDSQHL